MKRPAFQFYPGDWRKDVELRSCSVAARGLWIDLLCIAHECEPYGHLVLNAKPMTAAKIAGQIGGITPAQTQRLIDELLDNGVARQLEDGTIYSKRMVEDERIRNARAEGGKAGAEHGAKGAEHGKKGGRPPSDKGGSETPLTGEQKPPPSSSSSSSASLIPSVPDGTGAVAPPPTDRDAVFANGVTLLTAAGISDKNARSFLAMQCKQHGETAVRQALERCAVEQPIQPVPWLQALLKAAPRGAATKTDRIAQANIAVVRAFAERTAT